MNKIVQDCTKGGNVSMFDIESIQALYRGNAWKYTHHFGVRLRERNIKFAEVKLAVLNGEIIEERPDDVPLPSIIILGYTQYAEPLHVVISVDDDLIWFVTAYVPSRDIWEIDNKTRKAGAL